MARERWGSRIGIVMAVAGSAIGLGNFLRFPVQAAQNGGGAFMIPYFVALLLLGLPLMWVEWTVGRFGGGFGHSTAPGVFHTLWNKNRFIKYFGVIGIFGPIVIYIYYVYIESWLLGYSLFALSGAYAKCADERSMAAFLHSYQGVANNEFFSGMGAAYWFFLLTFGMNALVVYFGIQGGIETVCKWGLPILFLLAIALAVRVFALGAPDPARPDWNVANGLGFLWNPPDWRALTDAKVWLAAAGQIFFTLSVGIGVILTYASYLTKKDDVALSGLSAAMTNEVAEVILGGSIVIPAALAFLGPDGIAKVATGGSFNLGFVTMPLVLQKTAMGNIFGFCWFALLFIAGITSSVSLAQPAVAFLEDEFGFTKKKAVLIFALGTFVLCHGPILFLEHGVLDELDFWAVNFCLVFFALVEALLFAWVFGIEGAWTELHVGSDISIPRFYRFIIKYITPAFLVAILGYWLYQDGIDVLLLKRGAYSAGPIAPADLPYVIGTRILLLALFAFLAVCVWIVWRRRAKETAA
ncbi:MAG: sodium-dependent transporter [Planctomycetota bacterium]|nr:sodium-dependent transporter [Planctomycetota bacterium]